MFEVLDPSQPWRIELPSDDGLRDRVLVARGGDGREVRRWTYHYHPMGSWTPDNWEFGHWTFEDVIAACRVNGWTLWSLPADGEGT